MVICPTCSAPFEMAETSRGTAEQAVRYVSLGSGSLKGEDILGSGWNFK